MGARVVVAMSGGVDSSVVAALLIKQGYECIGMHLKFWSDDSSAEGGEGAEDGTVAASPSQPQNKCCTLGSLEDARRIATKLSMPFYVMNVRERFKEKVVDYFLDGYAKGETPNPCIKCNKTIKFGELLARVHELKADYLATGHYVKKVALAGGGFALHMAADKAKDQSYFLYHLSQEKLARVLFPLGDLLKTEVYERAQQFGFTRVAKKKESQGVCFFKEATPAGFLKRHLERSLFEGGPIVTKDGMVLGMHHGLPLYTIGQRQGLGIGGVQGERDGEPWYVIAIDRVKNSLIVGHRCDCGRMEFRCRDMCMISGGLPIARFEASVRIRHRGERIPAVVSMHGKDGVITVSEPLIGLSPGQAAVFYDGERVLGGGTIVSGLTTEASTYYEKEAREKEARGTARCVSAAH